MAIRANVWRLLGRRVASGPNAADANTSRPPARQLAPPTLQIEESDPLFAIIERSSGLIEIDRLQIDSPSLRLLREAGIKLAVPLISNGELVGLLNLGPRLSEQGYSPDDQALLANLGTQAAPALRVAQLARLQREEAAERERIAQELRVARLIQQTLLPKEVPAPKGWHVAAHYQPAREVGGDFYDFVEFPDGRLGIFIGDVTDKGVPAALVMASTRASLRAAAERWISPGRVLEEVNNIVVPEMPSKMFVTCLYAVLDPASGKLRYANAGQDLPLLRRQDGVVELRATGTPLGWFPNVTYEEREATLGRGETVVFYSDGLVEAHNAAREMFGTQRLAGIVGELAGGADLIDKLLYELGEFAGEGWEQEDDVTLVTVQHCPCEDEGDWHSLASYSVPSEPGNERLAIAKLNEAIAPLRISPRRMERLATAVGEATMNAMEHGNRYNPDLPVEVEVRYGSHALSVSISDHGRGGEIPTPESPDLEAKLAGAQSPRGWGLFLMRSMVDDVHVTTEAGRHVIELILQLGGDADGREASRG